MKQRGQKQQSYSLWKGLSMDNDLKRWSIPVTIFAEDEMKKIMKRAIASQKNGWRWEIRRLQLEATD